MTMMTTKAQTASPTKISRNKSLVSSPRTRPLKKRKISMEAVAFTTTIITANDAEEETAAVLRRKALAARLRANGVSRRLVLKPSDFARSIFVKNMTNKNTGCDGPAPLHVLPFPDPTTTDIAIHQKYSQELYTYVRTGTDLEGFKQCLRELHQQYNGLQQHFRCCNRFGESLLHLACRRGRTDFVRFIIEEMGTNTSTAREMLTVRDDCNKTPLHDACWTPSPNFELVELILKHAPEQVLMEDVRGNTPFDYVQKENYAVWLKFLWQRKSMLRGSVLPEQASN